MLFVNQGAGTFAAPVSIAVGGDIQGLAVTDLDGDGDVDIAAADGNNARVWIVRNQGSGIWGAGVSYSVGTTPQDLVAADLDGDGDLDLAVANLNSENVSILLNSGNGTFPNAIHYATGPRPADVAASDLDNDGDLDLFTSNNDGNDLVVLANRSDGTFGPAVHHAIGLGVRFGAATDLNGDGLLDVVVSTSGDSYGDSTDDAFAVLLKSSRCQLAGTWCRSMPGKSPPICRLATAPTTNLRYWRMRWLKSLLPLTANATLDRGTLISNLTGGVTDADAGALKGVAITATNETNGTMQFSLDDGATWTNVGTVSNSSALLLPDDTNTRIRFRPTGGFFLDRSATS